MDLLGILRIKDSNGNWVSVPGLKGDTGEPFKILGIYATAAALEADVTDPEVGDVYLVGTTGAYDIYLYLADGWHNTGRYMPKGDQGDPAPAASITPAVETWLAANVDPETGYVLDRTLSIETAAAPADLVGDLKSDVTLLNTDVNEINLSVAEPTILVDHGVSLGNYFVQENGTARASNYWNLFAIPVSAGEIYDISTGIANATATSSIKAVFAIINKVVTASNVTSYTAADVVSVGGFKGGSYGAYNGFAREKNVKIPDTGVTLLISCNANSIVWPIVKKCTDISVSNLKSTVKSWEKYDGKFMVIGYSLVSNPNHYAINTVKMYNYVGKNAYDAIKGDVRLTSDNKLVMCHDPGFTLDTNGEIISYNASNNVLIHDMTLAEVKELVFAQKTSDNEDMHVPSFEEYILVCKKYGKPAFITVRDEYLDTIIPILFSTLDSLQMRNNVIINSRTFTTITEIRKVDNNIPVIYTVTAQGTALSATDVRDATLVDNCALGYFVTNKGTLSELETRLTRDSVNLAAAKENGVRIIAAITTSEMLETLLNSGFYGTTSDGVWE